MATLKITLQHAQRGSFTVSHPFGGPNIVFTDGSAEVADDVALKLNESFPSEYKLPDLPPDPPAVQGVLTEASATAQGASGAGTGAEADQTAGDAPGGSGKASKATKTK